MLNEVQEFLDYTQQPTYASSGPRDTAYLGRFTLDAILGFRGLERIFTILARGYLFQNDAPYENVDNAKDALCAWCSIPEGGKAKENWEYRTCFPELHNSYPELVDKEGKGWFIRHIHTVTDFIEDNPAKVSAAARKSLSTLRNGFDRQWRQKVKQYQTPIFQDTTEGIWTLRFDDVIANALTLGPLREQEVSISDRQKEKIAPRLPKGVTMEHIATLIAYYEANKSEDSDWVVLPATSFNCYFGTTAFSKKALPAVTGLFIQRSEMSHGSGRYRVLEAFL